MTATSVEDGASVEIGSKWRNKRSRIPAVVIEIDRDSFRLKRERMRSTWKWRDHFFREYERVPKDNWIVQCEGALPSEPQYLGLNEALAGAYKASHDANGKPAYVFVNGALVATVYSDEAQSDDLVSKNTGEQR